MKKKISFMIKFTLAFTITLIVLEVFLQLTQISLPSTVTIDKKLGRKFRPHARIMLAAEGFRMGKINQYGYTGTPYPPERTREALRIALIGDSYVEGHYLPEHYYFGKILEEELTRLLQRKVEVLNFGLAGLNFRRMYINYLGWITTYKPDITLFFVAPFDLLKREVHLGPRCHMANGSLVINYDFNQSRSYKLRARFEFLRNFSFYSLFQKAYALYRMGRSGDIFLGTLNPFKDGDGKEKTAKTPSRETDTFFEINRAILKELRSINDTGKSRNVVVLKTDIPAYYKELIKMVGVPMVDLSKELKKMEESGTDPYYWKSTRKKGHWNHEAQRVIGDYLARSFAQGDFVINRHALVAK